MYSENRRPEGQGEGEEGCAAPGGGAAIVCATYYLSQPLSSVSQEELRAAMKVKAEEEAAAAKKAAEDAEAAEKAAAEALAKVAL